MDFVAWDVRSGHISTTPISGQLNHLDWHSPCHFMLCYFARIFISYSLFRFYLENFTLILISSFSNSVPVLVSVLFHNFHFRLINI